MKIFFVEENECVGLEWKGVVIMRYDKARKQLKNGII